MREYLESGVFYFGGRVTFRALLPEDGLLVAYWRNTPLARGAFYNQAVVTPDSHENWLYNKDPLDQVWIVEKFKRESRINVVGMTALHIGDNYTGEYGRTFVDPHFQGQGYAAEIEYMLMGIAFEFYHLRVIWLDAFSDNVPIIRLHEKTGWQTSGVDVIGHTHERGPVTHMMYTSEMWRARRQDIITQQGWEMPKWGQ